MSKPTLCWGCQIPHNPAHMAVFTSDPDTWPDAVQELGRPEPVQAYFCPDCLRDGLHTTPEAPALLGLGRGRVARRSTRRSPARCMVCGATASVLWPQESAYDRRILPLCSQHHARAQRAGRLAAAWEEA